MISILVDFLAADESSHITALVLWEYSKLIPHNSLPKTSNPSRLKTWFFPILVWPCCLQYLLTPTITQRFYAKATNRIDLSCIGYIYIIWTSLIIPKASEGTLVKSLPIVGLSGTVCPIGLQESSLVWFICFIIRFADCQLLHAIIIENGICACENIMNLINDVISSQNKFKNRSKSTNW